MILSSIVLAASLSFAEPFVVPKPQKVSYDAATEVRLDDAQRIVVRCPDAAAVGWVRAHLKKWFAKVPQIRGETADVALPDEGYRLVAKPDGIRAQAKYACEKGLFGVLETTWHHFGGDRFSRMMQISSCGAWGHGEVLCNGHFVTIWRQCGWDMGKPSYRESGWYDTQVSRGIQSR